MFTTLFFAVLEPGAGLTDAGNNRSIDPWFDDNYRPTNPAVLDADGDPVAGHLTGLGSPTQPPVTPTPLPSHTSIPATSAAILHDVFDNALIGSHGGASGNPVATIAANNPEGAPLAAVRSTGSDARPNGRFSPVTSGTVTLQLVVLVDNVVLTINSS
jgi:hypothetical protein